MRRPILILALVVACDDGTVEPTDEPVLEDPSCPKLQADSARLDLGPVLFGAPQSQSVQISNPCLGSNTLQDAVVDGDPGFTASLSATDAPGGGSVTLTVDFEAELGAYESAVASVSIQHDGGELRIPVAGSVDPDQDGDGALAQAAGGEDCDDFDATVGAPAAEVDNGVDDDCDGLVDEDFVKVGEVLITELMLRPVAVDHWLGQWVELRNLSTRDIDLQGWRLSSTGGDHVVDGSVVLPARGRVVLGLEADPELNGGVVVDGTLSGVLPIEDWGLSLMIGEMVLTRLETSAEWPAEEGASVSLDATVVLEREARTPAMWCAASSELDSGDRGTPGAENDWCDHIDHDGDGSSVADGDCDDTDATVGAGQPELWDTIDNDCNGTIDDMQANDGAAFGHLVGEFGSQIGESVDLSVHDWSGDGIDDLMLADGLFSRDLVFIDGADIEATTERPVRLLIGGTISSKQSSAAVPRGQGDIDGDGDVDLMTLTRDTSGSSLFWVFDAPPMAGQAWGIDDADINLVESGGPGFALTRHARGDLDMDGDGTPEAIYGDTRYNDGEVVIADLAGQSGTVSRADVQVRAFTGPEDSGLGAWLAGGDTDGDGYDELFAVGEDRTGRKGVEIWMLSGGKELAASGGIDAAASLTLTGLSRSNRVIFGKTLVGDVDADGKLDLLVGDPAGNTVHMLSDIGGESGSIVVASSADLSIGATQGQAGTDFALMDFDSDGALDLVVGAGSVSGTRPGLVFGLAASSLSSATLDDSDAEFVIEGTAVGDRIAHSIVPGDFDGDGDVNGFLVTASLAKDKFGDSRGALFVFEPED